jgi:hypothetical protein
MLAEVRLLVHDFRVLEGSSANGWRAAHPEPNNRIKERFLLGTFALRRNLLADPTPTPTPSAAGVGSRAGSSASSIIPSTALIASMEVVKIAGATRRGGSVWRQVRFASAFCRSRTVLGAALPRCIRSSRRRGRPAAGRCWNRSFLVMVGVLSKRSDGASQPQPAPPPSRLAANPKKHRPSD